MWPLSGTAAVLTMRRQGAESTGATGQCVQSRAVCLLWSGAPAGGTGLGYCSIPDS